MKKKSGFEKIPSEFDDVCRDSSHKPPMHLYIPPGHQYRHVCPSCGMETVLTPPTISW